MDAPSPFELDILTAVARIRQAYNEPQMADYLLGRLATCDVPRLLAYVSPEAISWAEELTGS